MPGHLIEGPDDDLNFFTQKEVQVDTDPLAGARVDEPKPQAAPAAQEPESSIPEKYRGKTAEELLEIAMNQDSLIGRHSNELGELRKRNGTLEGLVEKALSLRDPALGRQDDPGTEEDLVSAEAFSDDPVDATARVADRTVKQATAPLEQRLAKLDLQAQALDFERRHPTAAADMNTDEFVEFARGSIYRQGLAEKAFGQAEQGQVDFVAAEELILAWEDHKASRTPVQATEGTPQQAQAPQQPAPAAPTAQEPPALIPAGNTSSGSPDGKPRYSWAALAQMQEKRPEYYWRDDVQKSIQEAIAEGRVV